MTSIPDTWIKSYVDKLIALAKSLGPDTPMGSAATLRAQHVMDMVEAWRESQK